MCNWWYWWESSSGLEDKDITGSYITLYTGPNPPSPSLFPDEKLSVAATIWAKLKTCGLEYSSLLSKVGFPLTERNAKGNVILFFFFFGFGCTTECYNVDGGYLEKSLVFFSDSISLSQSGELLQQLLTIESPVIVPCYVGFSLLL